MLLTGDAMFTQRALSILILEGGGDLPSGSVPASDHCKPEGQSDGLADFATAM